MQIEKYIKDKNNKYKVIIDGESITLYDDTIIRYNLLLTKNITKEEYQEILKFNEELDSYYLAIKYITKKLRSELEIKEYLTKKEINSSTITKTIKRLKENNFLNNELFVKAYINDQINLTNNGPLKITNDLLKLGISQDEINNYLDNINDTIWEDKLHKYIDKKIKANHTSSKNQLKMKLMTSLINLGYEKSQIVPIIEQYDIIDTDIMKKEVEKIRRSLERKYQGYELEQKIKERLYRKGFSYSEYKENYYEE